MTKACFSGCLLFTPRMQSNAAGEMKGTVHISEEDFPHTRITPTTQRSLGQWCVPPISCPIYALQTFKPCRTSLPTTRREKPSDLSDKSLSEVSPLPALISCSFSHRNRRIRAHRALSEMGALVGARNHSRSHLQCSLKLYNHVSFIPRCLDSRPCTTTLDG